MSNTFKVCKTRCNECLFTPERIVSSQRMKEIVSGCLRDDTFFICHKFAVSNSKTGGMDGESVCCRGFYDTFKNDIPITRVAQMAGVVEFVDVEQEA